MSASGEMPRLVGMRSADMRHAEMPPATAATHATNRDLTTPPGSLGPNFSPVRRALLAGVADLRRHNPDDRIRHGTGAPGGSIQSRLTHDSPHSPDLPPLNGTTSRERIWGCDAAPVLIPAGLLAMQGR
jgi:hypothetical protein